MKILPTSCFNIIIFLLFMSSLKAKVISDFFPIDTVLTIKSIDSIHNYKDISINNDSLYLIMSNNQKDEYIIYKYLMNTRNIKNIFKIKFIKTFQFLDFAIYDSTIYFLQDDYSILLVRINNNSEAIKDTIDIKYSYEKMSIIDNYLYLFNTIPMASNKGDSTKSRFAYFNCYNYELVEYILKDPVGQPLNLFKPNTLIDFNGSYFIYSDIINYSINVFDKNNTLIYKYENFAHLNKEDVQKHKLLSNNIDISNIYLKNLIEMYRDLYKDVNVIKKVSFINDSLLFVEKSFPEGKYIYQRLFKYDLLSFTKDSIAILEQDILNDNVLPEDKFIQNKLLPLANEYDLGSNWLVEVVEIPITLYDDTTYQEKYNQIEDYYSENNINYSIIVRKYK